jgi:Lon protease-like protein
MLVITLCMVCPFEPAEKQALLEAGTETERARTLLTLLEMGAIGADPGPDRPVS